MPKDAFYTSTFGVHHGSIDVRSLVQLHLDDVNTAIRTRMWTVVESADMNTITLKVNRYLYRKN